MLPVSEDISEKVNIAASRPQLLAQTMAAVKAHGDTVEKAEPIFDQRPYYE